MIKFRGYWVGWLNRPCRISWLNIIGHIFMNMMQMYTVFFFSILHARNENSKTEIIIVLLKPNYFKKQCSSSFLLTWSRYTGPKWPLSTEQASPMSKIHSPSLLSTPWPCWTGILSQVSKNDDEKTLLLRVIWLYTLLTIRFGRKMPRDAEIYM